MTHRPRTLKGALAQLVAIGVCLVAAAYVAHVIIDLTADARAPAVCLKRCR